MLKLLVAMIVFAASQASADATGAVPAMQKRLSDRSYWTAFTWDSARDSEVWNDQGFALIHGPTQTGVRHAQSMAFMGQRAMLERVEAPAARGRDLALLIRLRTGEPELCAQAKALLGKEFGPLMKGVEEAARYGGLVRTRASYSFWRVGTTGVLLSCQELAGGDVTTVTLRYSRFSEASLPQDPIFLSCDLEMRADGEQKWSRLEQPMLYNIYPNSSIAASERDVVRAGAITITDREIRMSESRVSHTLQTVIDRVRGAFAAQAAAKDASGRSYELRGSCQKRTPEDSSARQQVVEM